MLSYLTVFLHIRGIIQQKKVLKIMKTYNFFKNIYHKVILQFGVCFLKYMWYLMYWIDFSNSKFSKKYWYLLTWFKKHDYSREVEISNSFTKHEKHLLLLLLLWLNHSKHSIKHGAYLLNLIMFHSNLKKLIWKFKFRAKYINFILKCNFDKCTL